MTTLKYSDATDRAFGLGGMAVAMVVWDSAHLLRSLDLDAPADRGMDFYPEFFVLRSQSYSARAAWNDAVEKFQLGVGLLIANLLCRALVRHHSEITPQMRSNLVNSLQEEGGASAGLTPQEVDTLFSKAYSYFHNLFSHQGVAQLVSSLSANLEERRRLPHDSVMEILAPLRNV